MGDYWGAKGYVGLPSQIMGGGRASPPLPTPTVNPGRFGPIPVRSGRFGSGRFPG